MKLILGCFETCWTRPFRGVASHPSGRKGQVLQRRARRGCPWQRSWVGGFNPFEKYESQLGWLFPIYGKIKHVPNHQPDNENQHSTWRLNPKTFRFCSMIRCFGFQDRVSSNFNICNSERNKMRWCKCQIDLRPMMYQQNRWALCNLTPFHFGSPNDLTYSPVSNLIHLHRSFGGCRPLHVGGQHMPKTTGPSLHIWRFI